MYHENIACHVIFEFQWMEMKKWMEVIFFCMIFYIIRLVVMEINLWKSSLENKKLIGMWKIVNMQ